MNSTFDSDDSISCIVAPAPLEQHPYFTHIKEIKSYGFNQLYTAERYGKKWLLKGLKAGFSQRPLYVEFLKKEFDILMSISYPYIVQAFGMELIPNLGPCIIMEYIDGMTLDEVVKRGITQREKKKIINQILEALIYVHEKQIVHRDLKPSNILITHNGGNVKLIDFGLADTDAYQILKQPAGTKRYMSPEQQNANKPDVRNDIYSFGRILEDMHLGRGYGKVIKRCLQPADFRYADSTQLLLAVQKVNRKRNIFVALFAVLFFVSFLGYLAWQIREIRLQIPEHKEIVSKENLRGDGTSVRSILKTDSVALENVVKGGIEKLDEYLQYENFEYHLQSICRIEDLDQNRYTAVAERACEIIEGYMVQVRRKYDFEQSRYVHDQISEYFSQKYLQPWNARVQELIP